MDQSLHLASDLSAALGAENLPVMVGRAPVRPLDNLMCPAVAIEMAPLRGADGAATPVTDPNYQQRVVGTVTAALRTWRNHAEPQPTAETGPDAQTAAQAKAIAAAEAAGRAAATARSATAAAASRPAQKGPQ